MFGKLKLEQMGSKKRLLYNAFFSSLSWVFPLILGFIATPIIVKGLGYEDYGIYSLVLGFISYSFTFGIGRAVTKYVSEFIAEGKTEEVNDIISITFWFSIILGVLATILIVFGVEFIVKDILQINAEKHDQAIIALYLACATISLLMIGQVFQSVIQALHRFDRISLLMNINGLFLILGNIVLVKLNYGLNYLLFWNLFGTIVNTLVFFVNVKSLFKDFRLKFKFSDKNIKLVLYYSLGIIGYQIFGNLLLVFERSWITRKLGAESLTLYVVPMTLALYYQGFMNNILLVTFPVFSEIKNQREKLLLLYQKATKLVLAVSVFVILTAFCASKSVLTVWLNSEFSIQSYQLMNIHFASFGTLVIFTVIWQVAEGFGKPKFNALISFIWFAVAIPLMIFSVNDWGNLGIAISRLSGILLTIPFIFIGEKIFLGKIFWNFWGRISLILLIALIPVFLIEQYLFNQLKIGWITLILGSLSGGIVYLIALWLLNFVTTEEKTIFREMILGKKT